MLHAQFHCGNPPPAAVPSSRKCNTGYLSAGIQLLNLGPTSIPSASGLIGIRVFMTACCPALLCVGLRIFTSSEEYE